MYLQPPIVTLPLAYISLNISKFPLFRPFARSQPLTHALNSAGPVCKPVSILLKITTPCAIHGPVLAKYKNLNSEVFQSYFSLVLTGNLTRKPMRQA